MGSLTINGVDPNTYGVYLQSKNGLRVSPLRRGGNIQIPLLDGEIFRPAKRYEPAQMPLVFIIKGVNPATNTVTLGSYEAHFEQNLSNFMRLVNTDSVILQNTRQDGSIRQCTAEVKDVLPPVILSKARRWDSLGVAFVVIGAFWEEVGFTNIPSFSLATGGTRLLSEIANATAPMNNMTVTFGPSNTPRIQHGVTGVFMQYNGIIAAGQVLNIRTITGQLDTTGGSAWTPSDGNLVHAGDSRLFSVRPEPGGAAPTIAITHNTGGTIQTTLSIKQKFFTG